MEGNTYPAFGNYNHNSFHDNMTSTSAHPNAISNECHPNQAASTTMADPVTSEFNDVFPQGLRITPPPQDTNRPTWLNQINWDQVDWSQIADFPVSNQGISTSQPAQRQQNPTTGLSVSDSAAQHSQHIDNSLPHQAGSFSHVHNFPNSKLRDLQALFNNVPQNGFVTGDDGQFVGQPAYTVETMQKGALGGQSPHQTQSLGQPSMSLKPSKPTVSSSRTLKKRKHDSTAQQINIPTTKPSTKSYNANDGPQTDKASHISQFQPILPREASGPIDLLGPGRSVDISLLTQPDPTTSNPAHSHLSNFPTYDRPPQQGRAFTTDSVPRPRAHNAGASSTSMAFSGSRKRGKSQTVATALEQQVANLPTYNQAIPLASDSLSGPLPQSKRLGGVRSALNAQPKQSPPALSSIANAGQASTAKAPTIPGPELAASNEDSTSVLQSNNTIKPSPFAKVPPSRIQPWSKDFASIAKMEAWHAVNKEQIKTFSVAADDYDQFDEARILQLASDLYGALLSLPRGPDPTWEEKVKRHFYQYQNNAIKELCRLLGSEHGRKMAQVHCLRVAQEVVKVHTIGVPESHLLDEYTATDNWGTDLDLKCSDRAIEVVKVVRAHKWLAFRIAKGEEVPHLVRHPKSQLREHLFNIKSNGGKPMNKLPNDPNAPYAVCHINDKELLEDPDHPALAAYRKAKGKKTKAVAKTKSTKKPIAAAAQPLTNFPLVNDEPDATSTEANKDESSQEKLVQEEVTPEASNKRSRSAMAGEDDEDEVIFVGQRPVKRPNIEGTLVSHATASSPNVSMPVDDQAATVPTAPLSTPYPPGEGNSADSLSIGPDSEEEQTAVGVQTDDMGGFEDTDPDFQTTDDMVAIVLAWNDEQLQKSSNE